MAEEKYLYHVTTDTKHSRKSYRSEVADSVIDLLKRWLPNLLEGNRSTLFDDYNVRVDWHNSKSIGFTVARGDVDIVKFSVCSHSKRAAPSWQYVDGAGDPPPVPFVAAGIISSN